VIVGIGIDIVDLDEFRARLSDALVREVFLPAETAYASSRARPWESYAARFAAKESAMKALGAGLSQGVRWTDVEVLRGADGDLGLRLDGRALEAAREKRVTRSWVSVSHSETTAAAVVVLEA